MFTATRLQIGAYLLAVCPFSIAFLVFLNSSVSFVVTDLINLEHGQGNAVGTLGFADELLALVACPAWGIVSDRIGVRAVCVLGYLIIALALVLFVQAKNVYPQLLLGRLLFSIGGAAASTMVTALLPAMVVRESREDDGDTIRGISGVSARGFQGPNYNAARSSTPAEPAMTPSISSEITITPDRLRSRSRSDDPSEQSTRANAPSRIAGWVGMAAGCGALVALVLFLPLPARFQKGGSSPAQALRNSFYVVAAIAILIAAFCFFGLRHLRGEEQKGLQSLFRSNNNTTVSAREFLSLSFLQQFYKAFMLGFRRIDIGLGYVGGFVARASSVGISLFVPLLINAYFHSSGLCSSDDADTAPDGGLGAIKRRCPKAYLLAAELTGVSQLVALICAPFFGYLSARSRRLNIPLLAAAIAGIAGYVGLAVLPSPRPNGPGGSPVVFLIMCFIGISQIGAIVCSLGILGNGVVNETGHGSHNEAQPATEASASDEERTRLLPAGEPDDVTEDLTYLKGSIAGMYSLYGGAGILILTKMGGALFDTSSPGAPFYIMAGFNAILLATGVCCGVIKLYQSKQKAFT